MIGVAVVGASGRTGSRVAAQVLRANDLELVAAVVSPGSAALGVDVGGVVMTELSASTLERAQVVIDFSLPAGLGALLDHLGERALVTGTTGLDGDLMNRLASQASSGPVLTAANFSTGINVLLDAVARAAAALPGWHVEVVEAHHVGKRDAPSGTALALGKAAAFARGLDLDSTAIHGRHGADIARTADEIGFHTLRAGDVVGDHRVWLVGEGERLELRHAATSRDVFAAGAIRAARWLLTQKPGRYTMAEMLGLETD
jgi:4-hydroxy-tetrahydrodipicolinate reductase